MHINKHDKQLFDRSVFTNPHCIHNDALNILSFQVLQRNV